MSSIPNWKNKFCVCGICNEEIKDKDIIAVAKNRQVFNKISMDALEMYGVSSLNVAHVRNKAFYFHEQCFYTKISNNEHINDSLKNDEINEEDHKKMRILAGLDT